MKSKYVVLVNNRVACYEKFIDEYDAKVWALHNNYAKLKTINTDGDKKIVLNYGVRVEKLK